MVPAIFYIWLSGKLLLVGGARFNLSRLLRWIWSSSPSDHNLRVLDVPAIRDLQRMKGVELGVSMGRIRSCSCRNILFYYFLIQSD
jgi:hypothetical protein